MTTSLVPRDPLGELPGGVALSVVASARAGIDDRDAIVVPVPTGMLARLGDRISGLLQGSAALRMIQRISPLDPGARFWRAVRGDARVAGLIGGADLLIAGDRDANFTCWQLARRMDGVAVGGYAAGKKELLRQVAG
ncbi:hypothetical protein [Microbacterium sulfonylureivorans]|uniref:hypothetical protein n=1 Tax=Microbacterium sulfonylureivorans TaxID=2486854 RepID=UPI000FD6DD85|nr:hypothetical protein [Microbacterium sulfonylureivorans]